MDWSCVYYLWIIEVFLSAVWTLILTAPIPGEDPLVSNWCNAKFLQICFDEENKLIYILDDLRVSKFAFFNIFKNIFTKNENTLVRESVAEPVSI